MRFIRRIAVMAGYLLYGAVVLVLLLWWLFPAQSARTYLEYHLQRVYPSLTWTVGAVRLQLPDRAVVHDVRVKDKKNSKIEWLRLETAQIRPDYVASLRRQRPVFLYRLELLEGTMTGELILDRSGDLVCLGRLAELQVAGLTQLQQLLGRQVSGRLSGQYKCQIRPTEKRLDRLEGHFSLEDGKVTMRAPVLGHSSFEFQKMEVTLEQHDRELAVKDGQIQSRLLRATFSGTVQLRPQLTTSPLNLHGMITPLPELLGGLPDDAATASIRERLQKGKLAFTVEGTLLQPGIRFPTDLKQSVAQEGQR